MNTYATLPKAPRPYQTGAVDAALAEFKAGVPSTLVCLPTGTGKTLVAAGVARAARLGHGRRCLFIAHRDFLLGQARAAFHEAGLSTALEMGEHHARRDEADLGKADVVLGTPQTLRGDRLAEYRRGDFGLLITDEAHRCRGLTYRAIYNHFPDAWHLGLTATAGRSDGKNLGAVYRSTAYRMGVFDAIPRWLVPFDPVCHRVPVDLRSVRRTKHDLNVGDLAARVGPQIEAMCRAVAGDIGDRQGVIFTPDVASAQGVAEVLCKLGVSARYVAGTAGDFGMKQKEKVRHMGDFNCCRFQVVVCCDLLLEGWDCPQCSYVGIFRPTRSRYRYQQMIGRVLRPCEPWGKVDAVVADFDWQTDDGARDIVTVVDLFDDTEATYQAEARELARRMLKARQKARDADPAGRTRIDIDELVRQAEATIRSRPRMNIPLTGKGARYARYRRDPKGVAAILGLRFSGRRDMDHGDNPATDWQADKLRSLGVLDPAGVSRWGAGRLIKDLAFRRDHHLATPGHLHELLKLGVDPDEARAMTMSQAARFLKAAQQEELLP